MTGRISEGYDIGGICGYPKNNENFGFVNQADKGGSG
jgi:hypothetical protein